MLEKKMVIKSIKDLPDRFPIEEVIDRIILLQKIETGLKHSQEGKTSTTKEAKIKLKKWLK
jgi:hypothetical protein